MIYIKINITKYFLKNKKLFEKKMFTLVSGFMNIMLEKPLYKILIIGEESVGKTVNEIIIFNL